MPISSSSSSSSIRDIYRSECLGNRPLKSSALSKIVKVALVAISTVACFVLFPPVLSIIVAATIIYYVTSSNMPDDTSRIPLPSYQPTRGWFSFPIWRARQDPIVQPSIHRWSYWPSTRAPVGTGEVTPLRTQLPFRGERTRMPVQREVLRPRENQRIPVDDRNRWRG